MVTPRVDFRQSINTLSAWVSRLRTSPDDIPAVGELTQRALEAFLGRDGAQRVAVEQAARAYEHTTSRQGDEQVHTHALVPPVDGIVDFEDMDVSRLTAEIDPDESWGWPLYERWSPEAAEAAAREQATQSRQLAAAWGRLARDKRLKHGDPTTSESFQRHYQREAEPVQARERAERVLGLRPDPVIGRTACVDELAVACERVDRVLGLRREPVTDRVAAADELDRCRARGWSM
jgi:hypothetical protein